MSEFLNVYQFTTSGALLLETDRGFKSFDPKIKMAFTVRRTISSAPSIDELFQYSDEVLEVLRHEATNRLRWTGRPIGSSESWSPTLSGQEVFGPILKCVFDSALNRYGFTEDECKPSSRNDVVKWLNKFVVWAKEQLCRVDPTPVSGGVSDDALFETLADSVALAMRDIVKSKNSADDKMREMCRLDSRFLGWDSSQWAKALRVSDAAIRKTQFWKVDRPRITDRE